MIAFSPLFGAAHIFLFFLAYVVRLCTFSITDLSFFLYTVCPSPLGSKFAFFFRTQPDFFTNSVDISAFLLSPFCPCVFCYICKVLPFPSRGFLSPNGNPSFPTSIPLSHGFLGLHIHSEVLICRTFFFLGTSPRVDFFSFLLWRSETTSYKLFPPFPEGLLRVLFFFSLSRAEFFFPFPVPSFEFTLCIGYGLLPHVWGWRGRVVRFRHWFPVGPPFLFNFDKAASSLGCLCLWLLQNFLGDLSPLLVVFRVVSRFFLTRFKFPFFSTLSLRVWWRLLFGSAFPHVSSPIPRDSPPMSA